MSFVNDEGLLKMSKGEMQVSLMSRITALSEALPIFEEDLIQYFAWMTNQCEIRDAVIAERDEEIIRLNERIAQLEAQGGGTVSGDFVPLSGAVSTTNYEEAKQEIVMSGSYELTRLSNNSYFIAVFGSAIGFSLEPLAPTIEKIVTLAIPAQMDLAVSFSSGVASEGCPAKITAGKTGIYTVRFVAGKILISGLEV